MTTGNFTPGNHDGFNPEYGEVLWKRRLNDRLEEAGVEIVPIYYFEEGGPLMQVTQENTIIFINEISDELDCVIVQYPPESEDSTYYFRETFGDDEKFMTTIRLIGGWAMMVSTLYPMPQVVEKYEEFFAFQLPDELPEEFK
jgi:hypothetical protein